METRYELLAVVSKIDIDEYSDDSYSSSMVNNNLKSLTFDELIKEDWFVDLLKANGFYHKDDLAEMTLDHLNNFMYKIRSHNYTHFKENIQQIYPHENVLGVFQEVVGPERIKAYSKYKKSHEQYKKQQEEINKKRFDKQEIAKEKRRLKAIEKAKALLEREGD